MKIIFIIMIFIIASLFTVKTVYYGIYEINQQNKFGGIFVITFAFMAYLLFSVSIFLA